MNYQPDRAWWESLFATIDDGNAVGFASRLTADARFRFGNAPEVIGTSAIQAAVAEFFAAIAGSQHRMQNTWFGAATAVCEGQVTYTRHNGTTAIFPFVNVFELRGEKIAAYRIYIDLSPLFSAAA